MNKESARLRSDSANIIIVDQPLATAPECSNEAPFSKY
jgi:hypothetical protein